MSNKCSPTEVNNNKQKDCSVNEKLDKCSTNEPEVGKATMGTCTPHSRHNVKQDAHSRTKRTRRRSKKCITKVNEISSCHHQVFVLSIIH